MVGSENESKFVFLMNAPFFCNNETKEKITNFLSKHVEKCAELSTKTLEDVKYSDFDLSDKFEFGNILKKNLLSYVNIGIFKHFKSPEINDHKKTIVNNSIKITNKYKNAKASKEFEFKLFTDLLTRFEKIDLNESQQISFNTFKKKEQTSNNKNHIWIGVVIVLFILRMAR